MKTKANGECECCGSQRIAVQFYEAQNPLEAASWLCYLCANTAIGNWHRARTPDVSNVMLAKTIARMLNLQSGRAKG
jgi:hypothetical protein